MICTHNRRDHVPAAVRSLLAQTAPSDIFEILVVDNASTDGTSEVLAAEFGKLECFRCVGEPSAGVSAARNTGWREARGRVVAYLDDDMRAAPDWVERIHAVFASPPTGLGCLVGRVLLDWPSPKPAWLSHDMSMCLSLIDWGQERQALGPDRHFSGGNLALERALLEDMGGFPSFLGRVGDKLLSNEEVLLGLRIRERGLTVLYDPAVAGHHYVHPERMLPGWFVRRSFWQGVSEAVMHSSRYGMSPGRRARTALKVTRDLVRPAAKPLRMLFPTQNPSHFDIKCAGFGTLGYMAGLLGLAK